MIPREVMQNIRRIQINTSHVVDDLLAGGWHSAFKGRGIEFEEVRPYQVGDDIRTIDWNVTARAGEPFVKLFREEREMSVMLLVDLSASQSFGSHHQTKRELVTELGATLAFSAIKNNDKVGLTLFTDQIEKALPPRTGTRHVLRLIRELLYCDPIGRGTDLRAALDHLGRTASRRSVVFLISDFQDEGFERTLRVTRRKHDVVPIQIVDRHEVTMPNVGLIRLRDPESGKTVSIDSSSRRHRRAYAELMAARQASTDAMFRKMRMEPIRIFTGEDYVEPLQRFFRRRESHA
ncbi:hypothetical protein K227x_27250 [Rubripirellula lacrimiformis]|uniref:DUF58 domain-containing protein n=1 Tax=Rubripirellula lacrimiformis TaxID=1930273 RepID=A0A517NB24_9BACT|nr:DUF58 domain-containing protein [Rubripirellula lacrimiformis]QDT04335.1 hypothetical protein K227x_27250 [Rubripirellula lacrimiformis]